MALDQSRILLLALERLEGQKQEIEQQIADLQSRLGGRGQKAKAASEEGVAKGAQKAGRKRRRKLTAAQKKAISDAQKKRWAELKKRTAKAAARPGKKRGGKKTRKAGSKKPPEVTAEK